jgi:hypothetical protein
LDGRSSSRKACGSLYAGEKGGEEDGIEGVVGEAAELWRGGVLYEFRVFQSMTCASRTTMVKSRAWFEDGETDVAFMREILSEATIYWQVRAS